MTIKPPKKCRDCIFLGLLIEEKYWHCSKMAARCNPHHKKCKRKTFKEEEKEYKKFGERIDRRVKKEGSVERYFCRRREK